MSDTERPWLPVRAALHPTGLYFVLRQLAPEELKDAFLYETTGRVAGPENIVHIATNEIGKAAPGAAPAGLIFHVARSGSTLVSQMLKQHGGAVVYGEPLTVNEILVPPHKWPRGDLVAALRSLGTAFAGHARGRYVLKFSSWNTLYCDILAEAFPESPWVFAYRNPLEVGVSLLRDGPGWFRDNQQASGHLSALVDPQGASRSREEYIARVYGASCAAIARLDAGRGTLVPYETLPEAVWNQVAPHFGLPADEAVRDRMATVARTYSKAKSGDDAEFIPDAASKQAAASDDLRRAIGAFAVPELERLRSLHANV
jgi:hypothetical protein